MLKTDIIYFMLAICASLLIAANSGPTSADVRAMMAHVPAPGTTQAAHYERAGDAQILATAIANVATTREQAAALVVYGAYESGYRTCAEGDFDEHGAPRALGAWQLHGVTRELACDPERAARYWLAAADASRVACSANPPTERLAALVSGSCAQGHVKARSRDAVIQRIME